MTRKSLYSTLIPDPQPQLANLTDSFESTPTMGGGAELDGLSLDSKGSEGTFNFMRGKYGSGIGFVPKKRRNGVNLTQTTNSMQRAMQVGGELVAGNQPHFDPVAAEHNWRMNNPETDSQQPRDLQPDAFQPDGGPVGMHSESTARFNARLANMAVARNRRASPLERMQALHALRIDARAPLVNTGFADFRAPGRLSQADQEKAAQRGEWNSTPTSSLDHYGKNLANAGLGAQSPDPVAERALSPEEQNAADTARGLAPPEPVQGEGMPPSFDASGNALPGSVSAQDGSSHFNDMLNYLPVEGGA